MFFSKAISLDSGLAPPPITKKFGSEVLGSQGSLV